MPVENAQMVGGKPYSRIDKIKVSEGIVYAGTPFGELDLTEFVFESPGGNCEVVGEIDGQFKSVVPLLDSSQPTLDNLCGIFEGNILQSDFFAFPTKANGRRELREGDVIKFAYLLDPSNPESLSFGAYNEKTTQIVHPAMDSYELPGKVKDVVSESFFGPNKEHLLTFFKPEGTFRGCRKGVVDGVTMLEGHSKESTYPTAHKDGVALVFGDHLVYANSKGKVSQLDLGRSFEDSTYFEYCNGNGGIQLSGTGRNDAGYVGFCVTNEGSLEMIGNLSRRPNAQRFVSGHLAALVPSWSGREQLVVGNHRGPFASKIRKESIQINPRGELQYNMMRNRLLRPRVEKVIQGKVDSPEYRTFREE